MSSRPRPAGPVVDSPSSTRRAGGTRQRILDAALQLALARAGAPLSMAEVARATRISRQALYLHFADRAALFTALVQHVDARRGLTEMLDRLAGTPSGIEAVLEMVSIHARSNPEVWPIARAFEDVRRQDEGAERLWQDHQSARLRGCAAVVVRLFEEGTLRPGLSESVAADLLWTVTSAKLWEDLVVRRGWTARQYEERIGDLLLVALTNPAAGVRHLRGRRISRRPPPDRG